MKTVGRLCDFDINLQQTSKNIVGIHIFNNYTTIIQMF